MATEKVVYELSLRDLMTKGLNDINSKMGKLEGNLNKAQGGAKKTSSAFQSLGSVWAALAATGVVALGVEVVKTAAKMESMDKSIVFASGSATEGAKNLAFLKNITQTMPIDLMAAKEGFRTFGGAVMGSSLEGESARKIFTAVSKSASVMGMSADNTKGIFLALGQMVSKGTVQAEELRGQLGERLPGAFAMASKVMGLSTSKMADFMKAGMITAEDLLPRLAAEMERTYSKGMGSANDSINAHIIKLGNLKTELIEGAIPAIKDFTSAMSYSIDLFKNNKEVFTDLSDGIKNSFASIFLPITDLFGAVESGTSIFTILMKTLATGALTAYTPLRVLVDTVWSLMQSITALVSLDFKALANIGDGWMNRQLNIGGDFSKIWEDKGKTSSAISNAKQDKKAMSMLANIGDGQIAADNIDGGPLVFGKGKETPLGPIDWDKRAAEAKARKDKEKEAKKLAEQSASVSGSVPKVVNINIEALIKEVNNYLGSADRGALESGSFLTQLEQALTTIVTDVGIVAQYGR